MTYIIILNHNNWSDTVECLESLFAQHSKDWRVIVCDNGSQDNSLQKIREWAEGSLAQNKIWNCIPGSNDTDVQKPIRYQSFDLEEIRSGSPNISSDIRLVLLDNRENLGFSGGNNTGIRLSLRDKDCRYLWLLNNDTVVDQFALDHLLDKMTEDKTAGMAGSTILYYHDPSLVQAFGGFTLNKYLGHTKQIGHLKTVDRDPTKANLIEVEEKMFGIQGASVFVKREFFEECGLLSEDYFLYFEESDLSMQNDGRFRLLYAPKSLVYHKEGKTTGSNSRKEKQKSLFSEYYLASSRLLFTKKYFPYYLPGICFFHLLIATKRVFHGRWKNACVVVFSTIFFLRDYSTGKPLFQDRSSFDHFLMRISRMPIIRTIGKRRVKINITSNFNKH